MRLPLAFAFALLVANKAQAEAPSFPLPDGPELTEAIRRADAEMFGMFFTGCDAGKLRTMVSDSLEFYHDKGGLVATSGAQFVSEYAKNCEARKAPDAWRSRRAMVPESLHVDSIPGFGAMEVGEHLFYERQGDGPERLVGRAGFAMVWQWDGGTWKLHRVLSFGHRPAQPPGP
jgi:Domain of unknown function (DUF4440)